MKLIAAIQLQPSPAQAAALLATVRAAKIKGTKLTWLALANDIDLFLYAPGATDPAMASQE